MYGCSTRSKRKPPSGSGCGATALDVTATSRLTPAPCMACTMLAMPSEYTSTGCLVNGTPSVEMTACGAGDRAADGISVVDVAGGDHQTIGVEREGLGMTGVGNHVVALGKRLRGQQAAGRSVGAEDGQLHQNLTR